MGEVASLPPPLIHANWRHAAFTAPMTPFWSSTAMGSGKESNTESPNDSITCAFLGACLSISRGRDRGRFPLRQGGADAVGSIPNEEATTPHEGKSARSRRVGRAVCSCATVVPWRDNGSERWGVCGVARLVHSIHYGPRRAPCIRSLSLPTRLTWNTQTGS